MQKPDPAELARRFTYHAPRGDQVPRYEELRARCGELASSIVELTPASREQSLALTFLDSVCFFANAAIARRDPDPTAELPAPSEDAGEDEAPETRTF